MPPAVASWSSAAASEAKSSRSQPARRSRQAEVLGGVVGRERADGEPVVEAREERAIAAEREPIAELGQADQDEREERSAVPLSS